MPHLLSLVGKALGSILRAQGSNDSAGRGDRTSFDSDSGLCGTTMHHPGSPAGASPASEPSSRKHSNGQYENLEHLGGASSQSADLFSGAATGGPSGRVLAARGSAGGNAAPGVVVCSDASVSGSGSPQAAPQFFRASRASLSDATTSAAGEALRQASVTSCKHFSRENYNNYVRWVRATRGAMKLAGKLRARSEVACRNPHPALLLRCEHWLEVTDEQHRYGSNLRVYFDYWVAEMEAAELTPPQSPAIMSPSPSCTALAALAMQHQHQLQLASAIASAALPERSSAGALGSRVHELHHPPRLELMSAATVQPSSSQFATQDSKQDTVEPTRQTSPGQAAKQGQEPPQQSQQVVSLSPEPSSVAASIAPAGPIAVLGGVGGSSPAAGPGPSRFSNDVNTGPRGTATQDRSHCPQPQPHQPQELQFDLQLQPLQRTIPEARTPTLSQRRLHHHYHHHPPHQPQPISVSVAAAAAAAAAAAQGQQTLTVSLPGMGPDLDRPTTGPDELSSLTDRPSADTQDGQQQQQQVAFQPHNSYHHENHRHKHQRHPMDLEIYERDGSVHRGTDDGCGGDSLTASFCATRSHDDGDDDTRVGRVCEPLSPTDSTDAPPGPRASVSFMTGSCDPPPSLLSHVIGQRMLQQQRRRSCGESEMPITRHPAAAQPRPSSDAISALVGPTAGAGASAGAAAQPPPQQQPPVCGSPRRSVLCSPSKRFMLAAMIDMSTMADLQAGQQQQNERQQAQVKEDSSSPQGPQAVAPAQELKQELQQQAQQQQAQHRQQQQEEKDMLSRQLQQSGAPPATPQPSGPTADLVSPPATMMTPAPTVGGASAPRPDCTAHRAAKMMSNRASVGSGTSFFRWLDHGPGVEVDLAHLGVSRAKLDAERVKYLTPEELLEYELDVDMETGLLRYKRSGKLLHTGPDGRGSLDEHRRPPTPPPPAVPLSLLGESAAAWWRSAGAAEPPLTPTRGASCGQAAGPTAPSSRGALAAAPRPSLRRIAAMGTVPEGCDGAEAASVEAAMAMAEAVTGGRTASAAVDTRNAADCGGAAAATAISMKPSGLLPDLELRGHSASSLARLEPSRGECRAAKATAGGILGDPGSCSRSAGDSGSGGGCSRPLSLADAGGDAPGAAETTATGVAALSISDGEAGGYCRDGVGRGGSCAVSLAAGTPESDAVTAASAATCGVFEGMASASVMANRAIAALQSLPGTLGSADWPAAAPDGAEVGGGAALGMSACGSHLTVGAASSTLSTAPSTHGVGGVGAAHHHDEKVAKWIYVVDPELRLFVHPKVRGRFHHSSFLRGGAVVAAGGLAARHGRLRLLTADSGHYWPREENFRWLCEHLVFVGADLTACELRSKHMAVPAATGKELMEKLGMPPPWRLHYPPIASPSGLWPPAAPADMDAPPSPLAEHMHLLQLQEVEGDIVRP